MLNLSLLNSPPNIFSVLNLSLLKFQKNPFRCYSMLGGLLFTGGGNMPRVTSPITYDYEYDAPLKWSTLGNIMLRCANRTKQRARSLWAWESGQLPDRRSFGSANYYYYDVMLASGMSLQYSSYRYVLLSKTALIDDQQAASTE